MIETAPEIRKPARETPKTRLTPAERTSGARWRRLSFHALLGISAASVAGAAYS